MTGTGGDGPRGVADRSGGPETRQAAAAAPAAPRLAWVAGVVALAGWALVGLGGGGIDPGDGLGGAGPTAAFLALALGAPLAAIVVVLAWDRAALRTGPVRLALGACAGMAAWAALSMLWAASPALAWIDANRQAIVLCALVIGAGLGALLPRAPLLLGLGLAAAALVPVGAALLTRILPELLGSDSDLARLSAPVGYWNALALIAVVAAPGALWPAGARPAWRGGLSLGAAGTALVVVTVLLTYSRGGVLALVMALAVTVAFVPATGRALAALAAGVAGALLPAAHGLTDPALTTDGLPVGQRADAGLGLGWRLAVGLALAAVLAPLVVRAAERTGLDAARARRIGLAAVAGVVLATGVAVAVVPDARGWTGDRAAEFRGEEGDAVANDPGRLVSTAGNQRRGWWGEAWRGFLDAPVVGQGAGGFALVHLQERTTGDPSLMTREPHGVVVRFLSGTGLVGTALFAALLAAVVWGVLRAAAGRAPPEIGLPLAVMAAFLLQAAVDWSWAVPALTIPALAAAGVVLTTGVPGRVAGARPGPLAAAGLAAAVLVAVASAALPWWSTGRVLAGEDALAAGRTAEAVRLADGARAANPLATGPLLLLARAHTDRGERARALGAYRRATEIAPDDPGAWRALAVFLGRDRTAVAAWREVHRLDPRDPEAALRAG